MKYRLFLFSCFSVIMALVLFSFANTLAQAQISQNQENLSEKKLVQNNINRSIAPGRIGVAKIGMTYGEVKKALGKNTKFNIKTPFMVDWNAIEIIQGGKVQFRILYPQINTTFKDSDVIEVLQTDNYNYRTDKGIGPGSRIKQAEMVYGKATLSYNLEMEGREYVKFANQPTNYMGFRTGAFGNNSLAGIYPKSNLGGYQETNNYRQNAIIRSIEISCPQGKCWQR